MKAKKKTAVKSHLPPFELRSFTQTQALNIANSQVEEVMDNFVMQIRDKQIQKQVP